MLIFALVFLCICYNKSMIHNYEDTSLLAYVCTIQIYTVSYSRWLKSLAAVLWETLTLHSSDCAALCPCVSRWTQENAFLSLLFLILVFLVKLDYNIHHIKSMRVHESYQYKGFCRYSHNRFYWSCMFTWTSPSQPGIIHEVTNTTFLYLTVVDAGLFPLFSFS